jgi:DNA-binding transcriptional ArsR family regulator
MVNQMLNRSGSIDGVFRALADPTRRTMIERLSRGPASVRELARPLAMSLPAVMQHLAVLEGAGVVRSHKAGRIRTCQLQAEVLGTAAGWIEARRADWERRLDGLAGYLAEIEREERPSG